MNADVMKIQKGQYRVIQTGQTIQFYTSEELSMVCADGWYITSAEGDVLWFRFPTLRAAQLWIKLGRG